MRALGLTIGTAAGIALVIMLSESHAGAALLGGAVSFFSPCILPLLPAYQGFLVGAAPSHMQANPQLYRTLLLQRTAMFCLGFGLIFVLLGAAAAGLADLTPYRKTMQTIGGVFLIVSGASLAGILPTLGLFRARSLRLGHGRSHAGAFATGAAFACGWTPCTGPVLVGILALASNGKVIAGMGLLALYTLGLAVPFMAAAMLGLPLHKYLRGRVVGWIAGGLSIWLGVQML